MTIWLDAQLSPEIAKWIVAEFSVSAIAIRDVGLRNAKDKKIFLSAREASAVVMTKDSDFLRLQKELGMPPQVILLTCGNTSNENLKALLRRTLLKTIDLLESGETIVEIR
ncbi:MAG: DUF5615 family PIN-like protein [Ignavibacteriae bacterium]|nr:DUF5615 family PIN-like protein [Ignavibacteriota bacterium]